MNSIRLFLPMLNKHLNLELPYESSIRQILFLKALFKEQRIPSLDISWSPDLLLLVHQLIWFFDLVRELRKQIFWGNNFYCIKLLQYPILLLSMLLFQFLLLSFFVLFPFTWDEYKTSEYFFHGSKQEMQFAYFSIYYIYLSEKKRIPFPIF